MAYIICIMCSRCITLAFIFFYLTDVSDEGSSDVKEDLIQSDLTIRHRRAAPPPYSPPKSDTQVPDNKHTTPDDTEEVAVVWDSYEVADTHAEEANQSLQSDTYSEAEMVLQDAVDCHQGERDNAIKDVLEEVHDNDSCWKEHEPINADNHEEEEKVRSHLSLCEVICRLQRSLNWGKWNI